MGRAGGAVLGILVFIGAAPALAASVSYLEGPTKPEEKEVAQAFERVYLAYADKNLGRITEYFADGVVYYPQRSRSGSGLPPLKSTMSPLGRYEGKRNVGIALTGGTSRNHRVTVHGIQVNGSEAVVTARHAFDTGESSINLVEETRKWKFRKQGETWRLYELDAR